MDYYFAKTIHCTFDEAIDRATAALAAEGFGVLSDIDVRATMKKKLDVELRNYRILGACNPAFAIRALEAERRIGTMLPCNVIVQEIKPGEIEVAAVDPVASMMAVENDALAPIATEVRSRLQRVIEHV